MSSGATILTLDPKFGDLRGDILIEGPRIVAIAPSIPAEDAEIIPAERMIALRGFMDSHRHTWQSLLRGVAVDWTLAQYFAGVRGIMGRLYTPDDMYVANHLGALEALDAGITTLYDWSHNNNTPDHADEAVRGLQDAGLRAVFGYGNVNDECIPPSTLPTNFSDVERVALVAFFIRRLTPDDGICGSLTAIHDPRHHRRRIPSCSRSRPSHHPSCWRRDLGDNAPGRAARKPRASGRRHHLRPLQHPDGRRFPVHRRGRRDSFDLARSRASDGARIPRDAKAHGLGVRPSLSIDIVTSISGDMFGAMRILLAGTRAVVNDAALRERSIVDPLPLMSRDVLEFATVQGARACGLEAKTGSDPRQGGRHRSYRHRQSQSYTDEQPWRRRGSSALMSGMSTRSSSAAGS